MSNGSSHCTIPVKVYGTDEIVDAIVDPEDYERVCKRHWGLDPGIGYAYRKDCAYRDFDGVKYYVSVLMHRFLMDAAEGQFVDHINGNRLDNRRSNLRLCTRQQNLQNRMALETFRGKPVSSKYKGVYLCKNKANPWVARVKFDGKDKHLGCFPTEEAAAEAYNTVAAEVYGDFARLNVLD